MYVSVIWLCILVVIAAFLVLLIDRHLKKDKFNCYYLMFLLVIAAVISISILVNLFVYGQEIKNVKEYFPFIPTNNLEVWIGFFANVIAAIITGLTTFIVLSFTIKAQGKNTKKLIEAEQERTNELIKSERERTREMLESQHMPLVSITKKSASGTKNYFDIENISNSPLLGGNIEIVDEHNITLYTNVLGNLKSYSPQEICIVRMDSWESVNLLRVKYTDILGNRYSQHCQVELDGKYFLRIGVVSVPLKDKR